MSGTDRKLIVLTGATHGLGRALTEKFFALGHTVHGCGRDRHAVERLSGQFKAPNDFAVIDVTDDEAVGAWATDVLSRGEPPDLLINNAGVINRNAPLWEVPRAEFERVIDINVKGVVNVIRHFLPAMLKRGAGVVVNLSSGWGRSTSPDVAPYCASKWAIEGLTRALAQELPRGLAAVPLNPGIIDTAMLQSSFGAASSEYPMPAEWAEKAVPFLLGLGPKDNGKPLSVPD